MFNIRWPGILAIAIIIVSTVAILSAAYDPMPADGRPHVRVIPDYWSGEGAKFQTNFPLYRQGEEFPLPALAALQKIEGVTKVTFTDRHNGCITIGKLFVSTGIPEKAKEVLLGFATKKQDGCDPG
jgi:hypothetical protein